MTNEGQVAGEAGASSGERERDMVAYIGRASFRMEHTPLPGNDNKGGDDGIVQSVNHEDTMRIRIPAPAPDSEPSVAWAPPEIDLDRDIVQLPASWSRRVAEAIGAALRARLELPRWILASMTVLVFAGGVLVAASVIGGTRPAMAVRPAVPATPPPAPILAAPAAAVAVVVPTPPPVAVAERLVSTRRAAKPPAAPPVRRAPKKTASPPPSPSASSGESMIAAPKAATGAAPGWVDPFAE